MKIVACDDSVEDLLEIERLLLKYKRISPNVEFELELFLDACELSRKIQKGELADIYLLDMIMAEKDGIDIGSQIRRNGKENVIIYITSSADYALEAYGVRAVRYLLKPIDEEKFFEAVAYGAAFAKVKKDPAFLVKTKEGLITVPFSRIEVIENAARRLELHLTNKEMIKSLIIRKSFDEEIREAAEDGDFLLVHKSFLVNMNYVKKLDKSDIVMEDGRRVPISRSKAADVKKAYFLFVAEKYQ